MFRTRRSFYLTFTEALPAEAVWSWSPPKEAKTVTFPTTLFPGVNETLQEDWPGPEGARVQLEELNLTFLLAEKATLPLGTITVPVNVVSLTVTVPFTVEPVLV